MGAIGLGEAAGPAEQFPASRPLDHLDGLVGHRRPVRRQHAAQGSSWGGSGACTQTSAPPSLVPFRFNARHLSTQVSDAVALAADCSGHGVQFVNQQVQPVCQVSRR